MIESLIARLSMSLGRTHWDSICDWVESALASLQKGHLQYIQPSWAASWDKSDPALHDLGVRLQVACDCRKGPAHLARLLVEEWPAGAAGFKDQIIETINRHFNWIESKQLN